jgi:hypothetical protein
MALGCQLTNITCTDDSNNRHQEVDMQQCGSSTGVGGESLEGKSVEQAPWTIFGLFCENPNIFTS